jgi:hypothetical protein
MRRTVKEVICDIVDWIYIDTMVDDLDEDIIARCLQQDTNGDDAKLPTEAEVELFVCGEETEVDAIRRRWPALDAYLQKELS